MSKSRFFTGHPSRPQPDVEVYVSVDTTGILPQQIPLASVYTREDLDKLLDDIAEKGNIELKTILTPEEFKKVLNYFIKSKDYTQLEMKEIFAAIGDLIEAEPENLPPEMPSSIYKLNFYLRYVENITEFNPVHLAQFDHELADRDLDLVNLVFASLQDNATDHVGVLHDVMRRNIPKPLKLFLSVSIKNPYLSQVFLSLYQNESDLIAIMRMCNKEEECYPIFANLDNHIRGSWQASYRNCLLPILSKIAKDEHPDNADCETSLIADWYEDRFKSDTKIEYCLNHYLVDNNYVHDYFLDVANPPRKAQAELPEKQTVTVDGLDIKRLEKFLQSMNDMLYDHFLTQFYAKHSFYIQAHVEEIEDPTIKKDFLAYLRHKPPGDPRIEKELLGPFPRDWKQEKSITEYSDDEDEPDVDFSDDEDESEDEKEIPSSLKGKEPSDDSPPASPLTRKR